MWEIWLIISLALILIVGFYFYRKWKNKKIDNSIEKFPVSKFSFMKYYEKIRNRESKFFIVRYIFPEYIKREKIKNLASNSIEVSVQDFFKLRKVKCFSNNKRYMDANSFSGVYILYNKSKNMHYVGQGKNIYDRVNNHFTGKGNGDVYADYKYGDEFTIKLIALRGSGFNNLNDLERDAISAYNAYSRGYNKTRGNN